mmetsp:Transcript_30744/g.55951  ORF Transcript_30744/g.55951 Transcript_30744/m.55951 type:complete len:221 (-) Transcript_30744:248-910(-)
MTHPISILLLHYLHLLILSLPPSFPFPLSPLPPRLFIPDSPPSIQARNLLSHPVQEPLAFPSEYGPPSFTVNPTHMRPQLEEDSASDHCQGDWSVMPRVDGIGFVVALEPHVSSRHLYDTGSSVVPVRPQNDLPTRKSRHALDDGLARVGGTSRDDDITRLEAVKKRRKSFRKHEILTAEKSWPHTGPGHLGYEDAILGKDIKRGDCPQEDKSGSAPTPA